METIDSQSANATKEEIPIGMPNPTDVQINGAGSPMKIDADTSPPLPAPVGPEEAAKAADTGVEPPKRKADSHMSSDAKKRKLEEVTEDGSGSLPTRRNGIAAIKPE